MWEGREGGRRVVLGSMDTENLEKKKRERERGEMYNVTYRNTAKQTVVHRVYVRVYVKCAGNKGTQ